MMLESSIERALVRELRVIDPRILVLKFTVRGQAGFHDRLILLPGAIALYVELKRPGETPRKLQTYRNGQIGRLGFTTAVVDSREAIDEFMAFVRKVLG